LILPSAIDRSDWATRFPRGCTPGWYVLPCQGKYKVTLQWARSADFVPASSAGQRAGLGRRTPSRAPAGQVFSSYREYGETGESKSGQNAHRLPVRSLLSELTDLPVKSAFTGFLSFWRKMVLRLSHRLP
jgi:hypothetical protein